MRAWLPIAVACVLLGGLVWSLRAAPPAGGKVWQYTTLTEASGLVGKKMTTQWLSGEKPGVPDNSDEVAALNIMGKEGWELVTIRTNTLGYRVYIFKR